MRVLVISHAAVIPANQAPYCEMERLPDIELALVVPDRWRASIGGATAFARHERLESRVIERPVGLTGHINLHFYVGLKPSSLRFEPDVVYADEDPYSLAAYQASGLARRLGAALVFKSNQNLPKRYPPPFSWTERAVMRRAAAAIAIAPAAADVLREKGFAHPIEVIGHGIDPDVFVPRDASDLREKLGLTGFVIGYMGRFSPEKGPLDLVRACLAMSAEGVADFTLLLVGDGPERRELEAAASALSAGTVVFTGSVPHTQAADYLNCTDVVALPSRTTPRIREQFGRSVIEALACGVPVVGSDCGNVPVLINETGGGRIFPEGDTEALAGELRELISDPEGAHALAETGRQTVLERYTYSRIAARTGEVLRAAAKSRARPT